MILQVSSTSCQLLVSLSKFSYPRAKLLRVSYNLRRPKGLPSQSDPVLVLPIRFLKASWNATQCLRFEKVHRGFQLLSDPQHDLYFVLIRRWWSFTLEFREGFCDSGWWKKCNPSCRIQLCPKKRYPKIPRCLSHNSLRQPFLTCTAKNQETLSQLIPNGVVRGIWRPIVVWDFGVRGTLCELRKHTRAILSVKPWLKLSEILWAP